MDPRRQIGRRRSTGSSPSAWTRHPRVLGRAGPSALVQPAEVPAPGHRDERPRHHGRESPDRHLERCEGHRHGALHPSDVQEAPRSAAVLLLDGSTPFTALSRPPSLVLASASPRRQELLAQLGIAFTVLPSHIPEEHPAAPPTEAIAAVALAKARAVALRLAPDARAVVLGADTEVVLDGRLLGQAPRCRRRRADPPRASRARSRGDHRGGARRARSRGGDGGHHPGDDARLQRCRDRGLRGDGRAARQGRRLRRPGTGGRLVAQVDGCLTNVVGLPVSATRRLLERWGVL